jgi:toxin YoeB
VKIAFTEDGWDDYTFWVQQDRRMTRRINRLIVDIQRGDETGIGKPELLRGDLAGYASRRIDEEHRLVYRVRGDELLIVACRYHY